MNRIKSLFQPTETLGERQISANVEQDERSRLAGRVSALRLFLIVTGTLFLTEFLVMLVLFKDRLEAHILESLLDPTLMVIISFPVLYYFFLLPLRRTLIQKIKTEKELAQLNEELEARVNDRTLALGLANQALQEEVAQRIKLQDELEDRVMMRTRDLSDEIQERLRIESELETSNRALIASSLSERAQRLVAEGLADAALALSKSLAIDEVLDRILDHVQRVMDCTAIALVLYKEDTLELVRWRGFDQMGSTDQILFAQFAKEDYAHLFYEATQEKPVIAVDVHKEPYWQPLGGLEWMNSFAIARLSIEQKPIGYLLIVSEKPDQFERSALNVLPAFAANAALAIQNARLVENLTKSLAMERDIREELIQAEKLAGMGRTIASVAHELNNPIQTIKNCVYLIKGSLTDSEIDQDQKEMLNILSNEVQRIANLVSQLREVFRPNLSIPFSPLNLADITMGVTANFESQMRQAKVTCQVEPPSRPMIVSGVSLTSSNRSSSTCSRMPSKRCTWAAGWR